MIRLSPWRIATLAVVGWLLLGPADSARAQQPGNPFADPDRFFEQFFGNDREADREALAKIEIPPREEQQIGSRGIESYLSDLKRRDIQIKRRGTDVEYVQALVDLLRPRMRNAARYRAVRVYVAESPATDARSFPGGHLVVFRGMLEFAESEAALAGVLGHELSHLDRGHQLYDARRMKLAQETFSGGPGASPEKFFRNGSLLMHSFMRPFRPEEETEADEDGARWAYAAGYDPREMAALFLRLHERDANRPDVVAGFLRTHPYHIDRHRAVLALFEDLQRQDPRAELYIGRPNIARRIPRSVRNFGE
jgi:beta-barrel assembly-enhancing protease